MTMAKVLIIDDEPDLLELISEFFQMDDFEVLKACNGKEAFDHILNSRPDAIICDETLPDVNGHDILIKVKEIYENKPIFYFSTGSVTLTKEAAISEGATGLFSKPFDIEDLINQIKSDLEKMSSLKI